VSGQINKEMAYEIAKKLEAVLEPDGPHKVAKIFHKGEMIRKFGIRHASNKDIGHDHIPKDLNCSPRFAKELAWCSKYLSDYISLLEEQDLL